MTKDKDSHKLTAKEDPEITLFHGTLLTVNGRGVLLTGPSGSGKSDLALRLLTSSFDNRICHKKPELIADDQVELTIRNGIIWGAAPTNLRGLIEIRHLGIKTMECQEDTAINLIISLKDSANIERMPQENQTMELIGGIQLPLLFLDPFEPSTPAKIILATDGKEPQQRVIARS